MRSNAMVKHIGGPAAGGPLAVMPTAQVLALRQRDPWREATDRARQVATWRETVVSYIRTLTEEGVSQNNAVGLLLERGAAGCLAPHFAVALAGAAKAGRATPSRSAICEWCALHREGGIAALLSDHKGRVVEAAGWWGPALEYFNSPSKPDMSAVHRRLVEVDHFAVSYDQVRGYLTGVPSMLGRNSPARIGKNLYRLTEKAFIRRSVLCALPGDILAADGYCADVYLAHPLTGGLWRPELTVCIDVRSGFVPWWRADEHEGTYAVQNMWAECFARWNHKPIFLYVDNGSGHKNRMMSDDNVGFYQRAGIVEVIHALPGNPHGKGWIERFFRSMKDDFLKLEFPQFYCGTDAAPEPLFLAIPNQYQRALWLHVHEHNIFEEALNARQADVFRQSVSCYSGFMAPANLAVLDDEVAKTTFHQSIAKQLGCSDDDVAVQVFKRLRPDTQTGEDVELYQISIHHNRPPEIVDCVQASELVPQAIIRAVSSHITYEPANGHLEVLSKETSGREAMARTVADALLQSPITGEKIPLKQYDDQSLCAARNFDIAG